MAGYNYIIDTGIITTDTADVLSEVEAEWKASVSQKLNVSSSTPQGTMIGGEAISRTGVIKNNAEMANVINPNYSYGTFLDAVCAFLDVKRGKDTSTIISNVKITGNPNVTIQAGSRVQFASGAIFESTEVTTIAADGTGVMILKSQSYGDIPVQNGLLNIIDGTIGWGTCEITVDSVVAPGSLSLEDNQLKNQRNLRLAQQGSGNVAAIRAAVLAVANVKSCSVVENNTGAPGVINGVTFTLPNAMWVCVSGNPSVEELGAALLKSHQGGCPWDFGDASGVPFMPPQGLPVIEPATGLGYFVKYTKPTMFDTYVIVDVKTGTSAASPVQAVQNAVLNYSDGKVAGEPGFVVGASVSGYELGGAINQTLPGLYVKSVKVALVPAGSPAPAPGDYVPDFPLLPFQQAQIQVGNIKVNIV